MRMSVVIAIVAMGALSVCVAVISGRIYRDHAIDNERAALVERLRVGSELMLQQGSREAENLARDLRDLPPMASGPVTAAQRERLFKALDKPFFYAFNPARELVPIDVALYDRDLRLSGRRAPAVIDAPALGPEGACDHLLAQLARRPDPAPRLVSGYCVGEKRLYYSVVVRNSDGLRTQLTFDAAPIVGAIENSLGSPLRLVAPDGRPIYESIKWPNSETFRSALTATLPVEVFGSAAVLQIAKDGSAFYARLEQIRYAVFFTAIAVTLLVVLVVIALLERTVIAPLRNLAQQIRGVQQDESQLGNRLDIAGNAEVVQLAEGFNEMTRRLEGLYERLERMAFTDPLTQLPNRSYLQDRLEQAVAQAQRENKTFALFIMDLDRFKEINDTLGHNIGDLLLQQVAVRLRDKLRESDTIARMGGDEFAVVLPTVTPKQADMAARMLVQSLRSPFVIDAHQLDIGTSIGIALYPDHGVDAHTLIQRADVAMYAAKQAGCGQMCYDPQMDRHSPAQLTLMGELRQAVEQEQFVLYYQPKIGLKANRIVGVEALVRWRHPSGRLVMPESFIPLLEQTGLIRGLTGWVTHEALRMAAELRSRGYELPVAVNISARDLQNTGFAEELAEHLAVHQATADWLELEITESAVMSDVAGAQEILTRLAGLGFKIVIDDFGTGYSSLAYLKRLPVDAVKIDKSFVMGMARDENDAAIVYTSIDLTHNLGLHVVAEGVDNEGALIRLRARGCDSVQGMYLSRPLSSDELTDWLGKSIWGLSARVAC